MFNIYSYIVKKKDLFYSIRINPGEKSKKMKLNKLKLAILTSLAMVTIPINLAKAQPIVEEKVLIPIENVSLWRTPRLLYTFRGHNAVIEALAFSPDGETLVSGGSFNDPTLRFWSIETGQKVEEIRAQRTGVYDIVFSPNGERMITTGEDAGINIWNWPTGEFLSTFFEHRNNILSIDVSPDSRVMVTGGLDGIRVWNLTPQRPAYILDGVGDPTYAVSIHPNGYIIATGHNNGKVKFWNIRERREIAELQPHRETVNGLIFTPDGEKLITFSHDGIIKVWNLQNRQLLYTLTGHRGRIRSMTLNPDGKTLASAGNDGVRIWDIETGEFITRLSGHTDWVESLAFSNDGRKLATGSYDRLIRVWEIPEVLVTSPEELVEEELPEELIE